MKRTLVGALSVLVMQMGFNGHARAQEPAADEAQTSFQAGKWSEAAKAYEALVKKDEKNQLFWGRLGYARLSLKDYTGSATAYEKAVALSNTKNPTMLYNLACAYSRMNEKEKALSSLADAASAGFNQPANLMNDEDLGNIRAEARFKTILSQVQNNATPCANDPLHRQFDFWVGEWDVFTPQGQPAGNSSIQNILAGCVILENWTGRTGYTGKSFNFVDPGTSKWRQTWVDAVGGKIEFTGQLEGKNMVFWSEEKQQDGKPSKRRLTFFNVAADTVRQFSQRTFDEGKNWNVEYDLTYVRKK